MAVLMYGQMWVEGDHRSAIARMRHESTVRRLQVGEDDELELRVYYDNIKRLSRRDLDLLDGQLSSLQRLFYDMLSEEQERGRQAEEIIHDLQTRLQPVLALAENLYYGICRVSGKYHSLGVLQGTADELLKSALAMRVPIWNLGSYMPEYQFEPYSLSALVKEAIALYRAEAERREVEIRTRLQKPSTIQMSRMHLQHAINNLLHNAIKYSYHGRYDLHRFVEILSEADKLDHVLTFSNYGVGILPEEFDLIFEPGYKGKLTYAEYRSGSGMGLAITKEVIEKHHGAIDVESRKTDGGAYVNKFIVRLPRKQPQREEVK
jgi:signal transduction histidine kinase